MTAANNK